MSEVSREQIKTEWLFPLTNVTENRAFTRPGIPIRGSDGTHYAYELVGFEASLPGRLRRHPGFHFDNTTPSASVGIPLGSNLINRSGESGFVSVGTRTIVSYKSFLANVGQTSQISGVVWRHNDDSGASFFITFQIGTNGTFYDYWFHTEPTLAADAEFSVVTRDKLIYVYIEGVTPILLKWDSTTPADFITIGNVRNTSGGTASSLTGPGPKPRMFDPDQPNTPDTNPIAATKYLSLDENDPATAIGKAHVRWTTVLPSGTGVYTTPPQADEDVKKLRPREVKFAVQFLNSETGRVSQLSEVGEFVDSQDGYAKLTIAPGTPEEEEVETPAYASMEVVYDATLYDRARFYRSVTLDEGGYGNVYMHLDDEVTLADYEPDALNISVDTDGDGTPENVTAEDNVYDTSTTPGQDTKVTGWRRSLYYYSLSDNALSLQPVWLEDVEMDDNPPKGGAAFIYEETILVSAISDASGNYRSPQGSVRWSTTTEPTVESFPVRNQSNVDVPDLRVIAWEKIGDNLVGFSRSNIAILRKESFYMRGVDMHEGYGVVNSGASASVASLGYFVTTNGLKALDPTGALDDVKALDDIIVRKWSGQLGDISVSYDAAMNAIHILNPTSDEAVTLWMTSATVTELVDVPFLQTSQIWQPLVPGTWTGALVRRSGFLYDAGSGMGSVQIVDFNRQKTVQSLIGADAGFTSGADFDINSISGSDIIVGAEAQDFGSAQTSLIGVKVYNGESDESKWGTSATITALPNVDRFTVDAVPASWEAGDMLHISPVVSRYVSPNLPLSSDGFQFADMDHFRLRRLNSLGVRFTDVTEEATLPANYAKYEAVAYRGVSDAVIGRAIPRTQEGSDFDSIQDDSGPANYAALRPVGLTADIRGNEGVNGATLSGGFRVFATGLDFSVLAVRMSGYVEGTHRRTAPQ